MYKKKRVMKRRGKVFTKKQVKVIKKLALSTGELKSFETTSTNSSLVASTGDGHSGVLAIPQGDGDEERVGDQIRIRDIHYKVLLTSGTANGAVRVVLYQELGNDNPLSSASDFLPNALLPKLADLGTASAGYKILFDRVYYLSAASVPNKVVNIRIPASKLKYSKIDYSTSAGTTPSKGDINLYIGTNNTTASQMTTSINCRTRYYDN